MFLCRGRVLGRPPLELWRSPDAIGAVVAVAQTGVWLTVLRPGAAPSPPPSIRSEMDHPMSDMVKEFKEFVTRGNLIDLAIAVVLATFFAPIVASLVDGVIMRLVAAIFGKPDFNSITIDVGDAELLVGTVITAIVQFVIVGFVCFLIIKAYNKIKPPVEVFAGPTEIELLTEIRDSLRNR